MHPRPNLQAVYFNPLHHEGGDQVGKELLAEQKNFNPLHHEGGDDGSQMHLDSPRRISIHSTTRVETMFSSKIGRAPSIFQSTPPRGWRPHGITMTLQNFNFNPLHHEGGDEIHFSTDQKHSNFNPLHHEGGDGLHVQCQFFNRISIHSTTRVETRSSDSYFCKVKTISIHSTTRVETCSLLLPEHPLSEFQSTPPRGWRQQYYTITTTILQHISTNKSYPTPSNHGQPSLHTRKSVLIVQIFRCESPRKSMFASGSHQNTLYRFTARGQVRISAVLPH